MPYLSDDLNTAIEQLAHRVVAIKHGAPPMTKQALANSDVLSRASGWLQGLHPTQRNILLGAGLGGAAGLGSSFFRDKKERQPWQSALTGALAGGAIGTGLSAYQAAGKPPKPSGQFQIGDREFQLRPDAQITPEQAARLRDLQGKSEGTWASWLTRKGIGGAARAGTSAPALGAGGLASLYGLKQYMGPGWTPQQGPLKGKNIGKYLYQRWGLPGSMSSNIDHLRKGITDAIKENTPETSETATDYHQGRQETRGVGPKKRSRTWEDGVRRETKRFKPSTSKIGIPLTESQETALTTLRSYIEKNPQKARRMVRGGKLKQLLDAAAVSSRLDETTLKSILSHGAETSIPETAKGVRKPPSFRMSRANQLWNLLRQKKIVKGQSPFARTVDMRTLGGKARTAGKYAIPALAVAAAAAMAQSGISSGRARRQLNREIRRASEPVQ